MKTRVFYKVLAVTALSLLALGLPAQDTPAASPPPQLSFGVSDIIKLSQAKLSDDTIIQFINALGDDYALTADQIIYMRQQGVSEAVIKVMLHSRGGTAATIPPPQLNFAPSAEPVASAPVETPSATSPADVPAGQSQPDLLAESPPADITPEVVQPAGTVTVLPPVESLQPTFADSGPPAAVYAQPVPAYYPAYVYGGYGGGASFVTVSSGNFYGHRAFGGFHGGGGFHTFGHSAGHFGGGGFHH